MFQNSQHPVGERLTVVKRSVERRDQRLRSDPGLDDLDRKRLLSEGEASNYPAPSPRVVRVLEAMRTAGLVRAESKQEAVALLVHDGISLFNLGLRYGLDAEQAMRVAKDRENALGRLDMSDLLGPAFDGYIKQHQRVIEKFRRLGANQADLAVLNTELDQLVKMKGKEVSG